MRSGRADVVGHRTRVGLTHTSGANDASAQSRHTSEADSTSSWLSNSRRIYKCVRGDAFREELVTARGKESVTTECRV